LRCYSLYVCACSTWYICSLLITFYHRYLNVHFYVSSQKCQCENPQTETIFSKIEIMFHFASMTSHKTIICSSALSHCHPLYKSSTFFYFSSCALLKSTSLFLFPTLNLSLSLHPSLVYDKAHFIVSFTSSTRLLASLCLFLFVCPFYITFLIHLLLLPTLHFLFPSLHETLT